MKYLLMYLCFVSFSFSENLQEKELSGEKIFKSQCIQCHGEKGEGKLELKSPAIASLPQWYTKVQLNNFKHGVRGSKTSDTSGQMMHLIAKGLNDEMINKVCEYIHKMSPVESKQTIDGDLENGRWLFTAYCMACHRYNASGELVFGSPPLRHLPDWYLLEQLKKFDNGDRGEHPEDLKGAKMSDVVKNLRNTKDMKDVISFIKTL